MYDDSEKTMRRSIKMSYSRTVKYARFVVVECYLDSKNAENAKILAI